MWTVIAWIAFNHLEHNINLNAMKKYVDFCGMVMPYEKVNTFEFNQYMKSDEMLRIIYADNESLIKKIDGCANKPEKSSTSKIGEHIAGG